MPDINVKNFTDKYFEINKRLGKIFSSSLDPLISELGKAPKLTADSAKMARLQELIFFIPADRQQKYQAALDLLAPSGLRICGRPCDPTMHFVRFDLENSYMYKGDNGGAGELVTLTPGGYHHVFDFKWKSSTGSMESLKKVGTREFVKFRTSQQVPPFTDRMPSDMQFYWGDSPSANSGSGRDDHSIKPPRFVCQYPWVAGENVAEQWYQYSIDGMQTWQNIPGAAYLITKGVRKSGNNWVFYFRKSNWAPHNTKRYNFEVEYLMGAALPFPPTIGQKFQKSGQGTQTDITTVGKLISRG